MDTVLCVQCNNSAKDNTFSSEIIPYSGWWPSVQGCELPCIPVSCWPSTGQFPPWPPLPTHPCPHSSPCPLLCPRDIRFITTKRPTSAVWNCSSIWNCYVLHYYTLLFWLIFFKLYIFYSCIIKTEVLRRSNWRTEDSSSVTKNVLR